MDEKVSFTFIIKETIQQNKKLRFWGGQCMGNSVK